MSRTPKPIGPNSGFAGDGDVLGDPAPVAPYPIKRGGQAAPDRSRAPEIGPHCDTRSVVASDTLSPAPRVNPSTNAGPQLGPVENAKTRQEHGDAVRESRGVRTRPERPGRAV
jgi:hypothetical protein